MTLMDFLGSDERLESLRTGRHTKENLALRLVFFVNLRVLRG
jgi:hypothetical protein